MEKINLTKTIISNKRANSLYAKDFQSSIKSKPKKSNKQVLELYKELFSTIPYSGKDSHTSLVEETAPYLYPNIDIEIDAKIDELTQSLENYNTELLNIQLPLKENLIYPNKTYLIAGNSGEAYQSMNTVYVMQEGRKRPINIELFDTIHKSLGKIGTKEENLFYLSIDELNSIDDGTRIDTAANLSDKNIEINQTEIYLRLPYHELDLKCEGKEMPDVANLVEGDWYLDNTYENKCTIKYVKDIYQGDELNYEIVEEEWAPGHTLKIQVVKNTDYAQGIPSDINYDAYFDYDSNNLISRQWGKNSKYKGILHASNRIRVTNQGNELLNAKTNEDLPSSYSLTYDGIAGDNNRKIYKNCRQLDGSYESDCFGDFDQPDGLMDLLKSDTCRYYDNDVYIQKGAHGCKKTWKPYHNTYSIYGQPIVKIGDHYMVFLVLNYFYNNIFFWSLNDGQVKKYDTPKIGLQENFDSNGVSWNSVDNSLLVFPGLQGYWANSSFPLASSPENYFNPGIGGSNYGWTNTMLNILQGTGGTITTGCNYTQQELTDYMLAAGALPEGCTFQNCSDC